MKVALVYDRVNKWGGAERILLTLHELFPKADLYTSVYNSQTAKWAHVFSITTSFLQKFPFAKSSHESYAPFMPIAFESFTFDNYDLVISITSESAKGILTKPTTKHICYCLTPTRYLWSGYTEYFKNPFFKFITYPIVSYLRMWDLVASKRPDSYIAISQEVQQRIKKYYNQKSSVIYPPLSIVNNKDTEIVDDKFFLVVSRLVSYKRVDLAIKACQKLNIKLKIIGTGTEESRLKKIATNSTEFLGSLTDDELVQYYKRCSGLIFPGYEDFGLTIIEAQSFGKPVLAFEKGGALETIQKGKTGEFFQYQTVDSLVNALQLFLSKKYKVQDCIDNANKFSKNKFKQDFMEYIKSII